MKTDDNSSQKYQLYAYVCHAKDIKAKGVSGHLGNIVPLLHWMNRVKLKVDDVCSRILFRLWFYAAVWTTLQKEEGDGGKLEQGNRMRDTRRKRNIAQDTRCTCHV